jgi:uncharacterized protein
MRRNRRRKTSGGKPFLLLLLFLAAVAAAVFIFPGKGRKAEEGPKPKAQPQARQLFDMPPRPVQSSSSSAALPVAPPATPAPPHAAAEPAGRKGLLAIVIDDMGTNLRELDSLTEIGVPLTFSVIPGLAKSREVAETAHRRGYQVMVHMPMEPVEYPKRKIEANGLLTSQDDAEITRRVREYLKVVPHAVGANNHMGSRFTEQKNKMAPVLTVLKEKNLFFVDSRTTPRSVGYSMAREMGMPTASRSVFLDNVQDAVYINDQVEEAAALARKHGSVIAICHPHQATIRALSSALPALKGRGITLVSASDLVR